MSETLALVRELIRSGRIVFSAHAVRELSADKILISPLVDGIDDAIVVEDYPAYHKGPCVLVLQYDEFGAPVHLLWGVPKGRKEPAVLVTAYKPDPAQWSADFKTRKTR